MADFSKGLLGWRILIFKRGHERPMEDGIRDLRALLQAQLRDVFEQARDLGNRYLQEIVEANTAKGWNQKNRLQFRVRQRGNAIALEWYLINWYGRKDQGRELRRTYIPKRNKSRRRDAQVFGYSMEDLLCHTSGWDDDLVTAVESEASAYRRQAHFLADMLVTLGRLERFATAQTQGPSPGAQKESLS
ncbi:MAG: conjugative transfer protein MobI(A/C) [Candidatus Accumulibacter delftensis]